MPIVAPERVSLVIAGGAPVSLATVADLLSDWLRLDTLTPVDVRIYLPADERYITRVVTHAADWARDRELAYDVVVGADFGRKARELQRGARDSIESDADDDMPGDLVALLMEDKNEAGDEPFLIIAAGEGAAPDEGTAALMAAAWDAGITVLEIAALGLEEINDAFSNTPEPLAPVQPVLPEAAPQQRDEELLDSMARHPAGTADEAQADLPEPESNIPDLATTLAFVYTLLSTEDRANAARHMEQVRYRPLTLAVRHHFMELEKPDPEPTEQVVEVDVVTELKPRGRTRAKDGEIAVLVNEAGEVIEIAGKGRPAKGLTRKIIAVEDLPEHLAA